MLPGKISSGTGQHGLNIFSLAHGVIGLIIDAHIAFFDCIRFQLHFKQMNLIPLLFRRLSPVEFIQRFTGFKIVIK